MQVRNDGRLGQDGNCDSGEWQLDSEYILMTQGFMVLAVGKIGLLFTKMGKILGGQ